MSTPLEVLAPDAIEMNAMRRGPIVLLTIDSEICRMAACYLAARFSGLHIIVEERVSRLALLRGRIKRFGFLFVIGQLAFMAYSQVLTVISKRRICTLIARFGLDDRWPDGMALSQVPSVNAPECMQLLQRLEPQVVIVVGTRIVGRKLLAAFPDSFINYHEGITPKYRGIRGGYWAKVKDDLENFGVTVHLVDAGVDTGAVLYQSRMRPEPQDNYVTFPYLQLAAALPLLEQATLDKLDGKLAPKTVDLPSKNWSHPTIWGYIMGGVRHGAW